MPVQETEMNIQNWFRSDEHFNKLYDPSIRALAYRHWTPLDVARKAASFLAAEKNVRILDIGSGVAKFCLAGAYFHPESQFFGVEQRKNLIVQSEIARLKLGLENVRLIHANFTRLDFRDYDHFYFFNSFFENLSGAGKIDESIEYSEQLYNYYNRYLYRQLEHKPPGTRLATYYGSGDEIPDSYHIVGTAINQQLKFWVKV